MSTSTDNSSLPQVAQPVKKPDEKAIQLPTVEIHNDHLSLGGLASPLGSPLGSPSKAFTLPKSKLSLTPPKAHHITLTTHPHQFGVKPVPIHWEETFDPAKRGAVIGTLTNPKIKNAVGTHMGSYTLYRAISIATGNLEENYVPDFSNTAPVYKIGPYESWHKIVSLDPWGAEVVRVFEKELHSGLDIRPTIAITRAHIKIPELDESIKAGRIKVDNKIVFANGDILCTKAAIDPVWYIPGICKRLGVDENVFRRAIFEQTGGMFPELITRYDLDIFLPPIGGISIYIFGDPSTVSDPKVKLACRVHDECNGSDVFGSDICTCRPYLVHGVEIAVQTAQEGGNGVIVYYRKEGRGLGEVVKYLVYNARKRQPGGDSASAYFYRTKCVAGVEDARLQPLMPDALHWLGITKIDRFVSMSDDKYKAVTQAGIEVVERVPIPEYMIPNDAHVEMNAKVAKGYFTTGVVPKEADLEKIQGRTYENSH